MHKIMSLLFGIILFASVCGSGDGQSMTDSVTVPERDLTFSAGNIINSKYICGFTGSFAYADNTPLAAGLSSTNDSAIERTFAAIWSNVIHGRPDAIRIEKDADQSNTEYKYAAAKGTYTDLGNIVRHVFYKSNDLSPLLRLDNGWLLIAIALHEFAHQINGDPFTGVSRDIAELGADNYAGFIMGRDLKTTLDTALLAFSTLTEEHPTNGYPDKQRRMAAVRAGWELGQLPPSQSIASAFIAVMGTRHGLFSDDHFLDFDDIQNAIQKNGKLKTLYDTSMAGRTKVNIEASFSPGEFFVDSDYLYFKEKDSVGIVGRVAHSNRPEYRKMIYDNFYSYMYIDSNNDLITYVENPQNPKGRLKPIIIGFLSEPRHR